MRIRGYDEETEEFIGDVEELSGKIADLTKTVSQPGGISLFTDANKTHYKSTYQLLKDISKIYDDLTDKQQAGLLEALAGKRQGQIVAATIKNFGAAEEALKNMANSAGSAEAELKTYQESAEFLANEFQETFTSIAQHAVDRDAIKFIIKSGTIILNLVDGIVAKIGAIPALISAIVGMISAKKMTNGGIFGLEYNEKTGKNGLTAFGSRVGYGWFDDIKQTKENAAAILKNKDALQSLFDQKQKGKFIEEQFSKTINNSNQAVRDLANGIVQGKVTQESFDAQLQDISKNGKAAGVGAKVAAAGVKLLNMAANMLISMGVAAAIQGIVGAFDKAVHSYENNINKLNELKDTIQSLESDYEGLNSQLKTSKEKLLELQKIPNPTLFDQAEIERLEKANHLLEAQIKLKQIEIEQEKEKALKAAIRKREDLDFGKASQNNFNDVFDPNSGLDLFERIMQLSFLPFINLGQQIGNAIEGNFEWQQNTKVVIAKYALEEYKKVAKEFEEVNVPGSSGEAIKKAKDKLDEAEDDLKESISKIKDYYSQLQTELWALEASPEGNEKRIEELKKIIPEIERIIYYKRTVGDILDIYDDVEFSNVTSQLEELANKGELTAKKFESLTDNEIEGIEDLKKALEDAGFTDIDEIVRAIIDRAERSQEEIDKTKSRVYDLAESLEKLYSVIDNVLSKQEQLADAFKKIQLGASLTAKEVYELIKEMPTLAKYIKETADGGFTISEEGFKAVNEENRKEVEEQVRKDLEAVRENISLLKEKEELEEQLKAIGDADGYGVINNGVATAVTNREELAERYAEVSKLCQNIEASEEELKAAEESLLIINNLLNDSFNETKISIEGLNEAYDKSKSEISDYNNNIKTIDSAIKKLKEGSTLSYEEMNALIDISSELGEMFEPMGEGYYIVVDALEDLREQSYKTRNDYIDDLIAEAEAQKEAAEIEKEAIQGRINEMIASGAASVMPLAFESFKDDLDDTIEKIKTIDDLINKLNGWKGELLDGEDKNKDNDLSKELQNQIDSYKTILSAVGLMKDKYFDSLDKEIDALKDSKDALRDNNDERQRELDLIEARNNLENAKKRKIWVFTNDGGFQRVQDEGAVKEAEEKYRDVITDVQEAEIDKKIDELEKQKEALEEYYKAYTELEQNIQDTMTIEEAKKLLGLSEDTDLLKLPPETLQALTAGLAEAMVKKENEDNKDNSEFKSISSDDVLKSLGATVLTSDLEPDFLQNITSNLYDSTIKAFVDKLDDYAERIVTSSVVNNNSGGTVISPTFNIYGVTEPQEIAKVVDERMIELFTQVGNSVK